MSLQNLFEKIESREFAARFNILSGHKIFLLTLEHDATLEQLIAALQESSLQPQTLEHLLSLLQANEKPEYTHPYDPALAGYLFALSRTNPELASQAIERILQTPKLWWAKRLAQHLQAAQTETS